MAKKTAEELQVAEERVIEKGLAEYVSPHAMMRDKLAEMRGSPREDRPARSEALHRPATLAELESRIAALEVLVAQ